MNLSIKKLKPNAVIPQRATEGSAGYDLFACIDGRVVIEPNQIVKIPVGIALDMDTNDICVMIYARSGLASKFGITLANSVGVVDSDYRGEIIVPLINLGKEPYTVEPLQRIAQMVITPIILPELSESDNLSDTERGINGFGSTGE